MAPATYNFTIYQGTTFSRLMTYKTTAGATVDLSAYSARMKIKADYGGAAILSLVSGTPGVGEIQAITLAATSPNITITLTAAQTAALTFTAALYDLEIQSGGGTVDRLLEGRISLQREITA